jgi:uncharacterized protein (TIGR02453 family)
VPSPVSDSVRNGCRPSLRGRRTLCPVWPVEAISFLRELEANNDRDWFKANRGRYDSDLVEPARELAAELGHLGAPRLFRPYNDTRFHMRPPIKEQLSLAIGYGGAGGYYVELSLDGLLVAAGLHHPASDQLERYRAAIDDGRRAAAFERAVKTAVAAGLELADPELKRAPRGYPADHPRIDRLRLKELTVYRRHPLEPWLHEPGADERIRAELEGARSLVAWLAKHVGPSQRQPA